jgi:hypothetical protein
MPRYTGLAMCQDDAGPAGERTEQFGRYRTLAGRARVSLRQSHPKQVRNNRENSAETLRQTILENRRLASTSAAASSLSGILNSPSEIRAPIDTNT